MQVQYINGKSIHFYLSVLSATARLPHLAWANVKIRREAICCKLAQLPFHLLASNWKGLRKCNLSDHVRVSACADSKPPPNCPRSPEAIILPHGHLARKTTLARVICVRCARSEEAVSWTPQGGICDSVGTYLSLDMFLLSRFQIVLKSLQNSYHTINT